MSVRKMHADEVDIDVDLVRRLLAAQFPDWASLPLERFDSGGTVNAIYRLSDDMYVRLPIIETFARSLKNEGKWLPRLAPQLPLAVPEILGKGEPAEGFPFNWAVVRWLDADTFRIDRVRDLREAATDLAGFVRALRESDTRDVPSPPLALSAPLPAYDAWVRASIETAKDMIDADAVTAAWDAALKAPEPHGPPVWVHSDLLRGNVLVADGRVNAVIDWGSVHVGDPARDVQAAWTLLSGESRNVFRDALDVDDATWMRARGHAIRSVGALNYYRETNPTMVEGALHTIGEVLADVS